MNAINLDSIVFNLKHHSHTHNKSDVFWNDVAVRRYAGESDGFRIVGDKHLENVETTIQCETR